MVIVWANRVSGSPRPPDRIADAQACAAEALAAAALPATAARTWLFAVADARVLAALEALVDAAVAVRDADVALGWTQEQRNRDETEEDLHRGDHSVNTLRMRSHRVLPPTFLRRLVAYIFTVRGEIDIAQPISR